MGKYGLKVKWLTVASFELVKDGHHIVTDPFITLNLTLELFTLTV